MSLNWNLEGIQDHQTVCFETDKKDKDGEPLFSLSPVTEAIIWATMSVDIGKITEENAAEFHARESFYETLYGKPLYKDGEAVGISYEDVKRHVGLVVNVATLTRAKWLTKVKKQVDQIVKTQLFSNKRADERKEVADATRTE